MKKSMFIVVGLLFCLLLCAPCFASAESGNVAVSIPSFPVTVNGVEYNSEYSEYPFLEYNDITYMPMTYDFAAFMGISITFEKSNRREATILHIGNAKRTASELGQYLKKAKNKASDTAVIPDYETYISFESEAYDNNSLYPVINYKGVTYLPLTWNVTHTLLDWEYSFDQAGGLVIDSTKAVRPYGVNRMPYGVTGGISSEYVMGEHFYVEYCYSIYYGGKILWVTSDETKEHYMTERLRGKAEYLNRMYNENGAIVKSKTPPKVTGNILEIVCVERNVVKATVLVTIDLETGDVLSVETLETIE